MQAGLADQPGDQAGVQAARGDQRRLHRERGRSLGRRQRQVDVDGVPVAPCRLPGSDCHDRDCAAGQR